MDQMYETKCTRSIVRDQLYTTKCTRTRVPFMQAGLCVRDQDKGTVHKIDNFFGSDFEFCIFSLLVMRVYLSLSRIKLSFYLHYRILLSRRLS
jgi:hypothetical protein